MCSLARLFKDLRFRECVHRRPENGTGDTEDDDEYNEDSCYDLNAAVVIP